jgi:hypothetical protein
MDTYFKVRPYQLMCVFCKTEGGFTDTAEDKKLKKIKDAISANPDMPITLVCNVASNFSYQNPGIEDDTPEGELYNKKRDIDILQRMGLVPGTTMPARSLLQKLLKSIESSLGICGYGNMDSKIWEGCKLANTGNYEKAHKKGISLIVSERSEKECLDAKEPSVREMYSAKILLIRPHHLMCMACFSGGPRGGAPIQEDNLFEAIDIIRKNPEIPVKLIEGPCMVCSPCKVYLPEKNICVGGSSMALRDEKKDLDVLQKLGLKYGDVLSGKELYQKLFTKIKSTKEICGFGDGIARSYEWTGCGMDGYPVYEKVRKEGMKIPGLKIEE